MWLLVYADNVNVLGGSVHIIKENTGALVVASKETGLGINADKTKYMFMTPDYNAERSHNTMNDKSFFERETVQIFWNNPNVFNSIQEEITSRSVRECLLSFSAGSFIFQRAFQNIKIKICRTTRIIFPVVCVGVKLGRPN